MKPLEQAATVWGWGASLLIAMIMAALLNVQQHRLELERCLEHQIAADVCADILR